MDGTGILDNGEQRLADIVGPPSLSRAPAGPRDRRLDRLATWVRGQLVSARRHAMSHRPFREGDYGGGAAAPKLANLEAVNALLAIARKREAEALNRLKDRTGRALARPDRARLGAFLRAKALSHARTRSAERIWLFYNNLFEQRGGPFADMLLAMDRIAVDCYQACYMGLGAARSIPTPPPFAYVEAGYGPATYRRGVRLTKLGKSANPFPLVKLPHHRLVNPWALGAVPHEVGHNIQNDLKLWAELPRLITRRLTEAGLPPQAILVWARWHKEIYADLIGVLLIGPSYVASLMDVVGKTPARVARFDPRGAHPTSLLRPLISIELVRRIGFPREADELTRAWSALYPPSVATRVPRFLKDSFPKANRLTVDTICFQPHPSYGNRPLAGVTRFRQQDGETVREAAERLAAGTDPGILPERFFIPAVREALSRGLAPPDRLADNFYKALTRR